jgi:hypothetical protein
MRFHFDKSLHPGAAPAASVSASGVSRTGFRTPVVIAFIGDLMPVHALARRAMR